MNHLFRLLFIIGLAYPLLVNGQCDSFEKLETILLPQNIRLFKLGLLFYELPHFHHLIIGQPQKINADWQITDVYLSFGVYHLAG